MNILGFGAPEIILILFLLLLFFGKSRLPGLAKSLGESFRELKDSLTGNTSSRYEKGSSGEAASTDISKETGSGNEELK